ncbi:uncharacterized protein LOC119673145 [Teleopsis dalmanni]|uniref:uncharacterized protein LOC119673145 n=1 Tax=Teleopsis dalmanni TaxID=139649 RepID=UPI0018CF7445|nr:uncharacterized protein LOC119673145 [Teleopsis dalmanni]
MNSAYGYNRPGTIKNYSCLRRIALWAGVLGAIQSIVWIALTITGIVSYSCHITAPAMSTTYATLIPTVFIQLYFRSSDCSPVDFPGYDHTMLFSVGKVFDAEDILIWNCVYLGLAACWLISSVLLITNLKKDNIKHTLFVLYTWVLITLGICLMDLALGIIFGIDYDKFYSAATEYDVDVMNGQTVNPMAAQLIAGMVVSISLMIISFKGFVLWIINVGLMTYLLMRAACIVRDKDGNDTLFNPRKESDDILATRTTINAYEEKTPAPVPYTNEAFIPDNVSSVTLELNQEPLTRAARMSVDVSLQERRFRNIDSFQQFPPPRSNNRPESIHESAVVTETVTAFPAPDYSPPMSRSNGMLRNQRYQ